jgi:hypothetical protein
MPDFATIKKFAVCWSEPRLRERAKLWPNPLTWAWFLGDRCEAYDRAGCVEILSVAVAYIKAEKVQLPIPLRDVWLARATAEKAVLLDAMLALGEWLDAWESGVRVSVEEGALQHDEYLQLADALNVYTGRV